MPNELAQFENAARRMESLLAELRLGQNEPGPDAIGPEWMEHAQTIINDAGALLAKCGPSMRLFKTSPEIRHYRKQLELVGKVLQQLQPKLQAQGTALRKELQRVKRLQSWSSSVGKLM